GELPGFLEYSTGTDFGGNLPRRGHPRAAAVAPREGGRAMITVPELASEALGSFLSSFMRQRFGSSHTRLTEVVPSLARLALECIGNSDALYHNVEHTMLVTLAGHDILRGKFLLEGREPIDYADLVVSCLNHDC